MGAHALVGDGDAHVQPLPSDVPTLSVSSSDEVEGDQSIASRTKYQLARQRTKTTALHTESSHLRFYFEKIKNK